MKTRDRQTTDSAKRVAVELESFHKRGNADKVRILLNETTSGEMSETLYHEQKPAKT